MNIHIIIINNINIHNFFTLQTLSKAKVHVVVTFQGHPQVSNNEELHAPASNYSDESPPPAPRGSAKKSLFKQSLAKLQGYAAGHNYVRYVDKFTA